VARRRWSSREEYISDHARIGSHQTDGTAFDQGGASSPSEQVGGLGHVIIRHFSMQGSTCPISHQSRLGWAAIREVMYQGRGYGSFERRTPNAVTGCQRISTEFLESPWIGRVGTVGTISQALIQSSFIRVIALNSSESIL